MVVNDDKTNVLIRRSNSSTIPKPVLSIILQIPNLSNRFVLIISYMFSIVEAFDKSCVDHIFATWICRPFPSHEAFSAPLFEVKVKAREGAEGPPGVVGARGNSWGFRMARSWEHDQSVWIMFVQGIWCIWMHSSFFYFFFSEWRWMKIRISVFQSRAF